MSGSRGRDATYAQIQWYVRETYGFVPLTGWIAHVKDLHGLPVRKAPNRQGDERHFPCPADKRAALEEALRHFGLL
jgi:hypothetical protein